MPSERQMTALARQVVEQLKARNLKIVLAESCTGGLVSAVLTRIPGVSEFHCGSAVVYQIETKAAWLGVPKSLLRRGGAVSPAVAAKMVSGVLKVTPHADVAAAVTGHLGPGAPPAQDGLVYMSLGWRNRSGKTPRPAVRKLELTTQPDDTVMNPESRRLSRQRSAASHLLSWILEELSVSEIPC